MVDRHRFRQVLTARLLDVAALAALASPFVTLGAVGCGGRVVVDATSPGAGGSGAGGEGQGGTLETTSSFTTSVTTSTVTPATTKCFTWTTTDMCPSPTDAYGLLMLSCYESPAGEGMFIGDQCCYPIEFTGGCGAGRPFVVAQRAVTAAVRRGGGVRSWAASPSVPDVSALSADDRAALAEAWVSDARLEHASVASFARFALELLAVGAPADLVAAAHEAAIDEVHHARLCFALAGAYAGATLSPEPFPFGGSVAVTSDLAELAAAVVREGCVGETLAALQASEQLDQATDPAVRAVLARIAEDEANHAELAYRTVAWALSQGDAAVHRAVAAAFADAAVSLPAAAGGASSATLAAHGRPDPAALRATLARRLDDVVRPCAWALLGAGPQVDASARAS